MYSVIITSIIIKSKLFLFYLQMGNRFLLSIMTIKCFLDILSTTHSIINNCYLRKGSEYNTCKVA